MSENVEKTFYIIDGHALIYRSFYAIPSLSNASGFPTNALYGFVAMLLKLKKDKNLKYLAVALDSPGPKKRKEIFDEYKATRKAMPDDLLAQIKVLKKILKDFNIPFYENSEYEADDIIASLVQKIPNDMIKTVILTGDKDLFQLVKPNVCVWNLHGKQEVYDTKKVFDKYGFDPCYISDFLALTGDTADNIPGVSGIGAKTATRFIQRWGTLENILENIGQTPKNVQERKILNNVNVAQMSKELATLQCDLNVFDHIDDCLVQKENEEEIVKQFKDLGFFRLLKDMGLKDSSSETPPFLKNLDKIKMTQIETFEELYALLEKKSSYVFLRQDGNVFCKKLGSLELWVYSFISDDHLRELLLCDVLWIGYSWKKILKETQIFDNQKNFIDLKLADYLLNSESSHQMDRLIQMHIDPMWDSDENTTAIEMILAMESLYEVLIKKLSDCNLKEVFFDLETPLISILAEMEDEGVCLDLSLLKKLSKKMASRLAILTSDIYEEAQTDFNINSSKQLAHILFDHLKLPKSKKTKTGFSTATEVLQKLAVQYRLPQLILEYRHLYKLKSTYIDALPLLVNADTGRIHTTLHQDKVATGRLSSSEPNLQNIPIRTEEGRSIRKAIISSSQDHVLLSVDYSQIELRVLAHLSGDEAMSLAFQQGKDIHRQTASQIMNLSEDDVSDEMRRIAKAINFGLIYGKTPFGLSKDLGISMFEAKHFIESYFEKFPKIRVFMDHCISEAQKNQCVTTLYGRIRHIPKINDRNSILRQFAERMAINSPVQGTAADIIKKAMLQVASFLRDSDYRAKMILQIHDELLLDVHKEDIELVQKEVSRLMENVVQLDVCLKVNVAWGDSWLEAH